MPHFSNSIFNSGVIVAGGAYTLGKSATHLAFQAASNAKLFSSQIPYPILLPFIFFHIAYVELRPLLENPITQCKTLLDLIKELNGHQQDFQIGKVTAEEEALRFKHFSQVLYLVSGMTVEEALNFVAKPAPFAEDFSQETVHQSNDIEHCDPLHQPCQPDTNLIV